MMIGCRAADGSVFIGHLIGSGHPTISSCSIYCVGNRRGWRLSDNDSSTNAASLTRRLTQTPKRFTMSSVLRKKIEAGAGIPPAILQFHEFWDPLQAKVAAWIFDTLGIETKAVPETRRVVPGNIASAQFESLSSF